MNEILSYTDDIRKFISGKKYAEKNIQTSDGKIAYITKTGVAKPYNSINSLSNKNGCTQALERIDVAWGDMGIPVGSLMVDGQSCGNETKYVQATPPKTVFDWEYYIESNPDLNLTTEQQAKDHWESTGIHQGLLPNQNILNLMTNVGKIGYVDLNTNIHNVPKESYLYTGKYTSFSDINVVGTDMVDCGRQIPSVKYGDQIYIKNKKQYGSMNQQHILEFGNTKTNFFLRPPIGTDALTGTALKYGDVVNIAATSQNVNTSNCGWWGCRVGYVNPSTSVLSFGHGGETGGDSFVINIPPGTNYASGTEVKFGEPFSLSVNVKFNDTLKQGEIMKTSEMRRSLNGNYYIVYGSGILYVVQLSPYNIVWKNNTTSITGGKVILESDGNLIIYDDYGKPIWTSGTSNKGESPYSLKMENNGNLVLYDATNNKIWQTETGVTTTTPQNRMESILGCVKNKNILFNSQNQTKETIFTFHAVNTESYDLSCDVNILEQECNKDNECLGFIHSEKENTWQKMNYTSTADMYKMTDTPPKMYVRESTVDMKDKSCSSGTAQFIDSTMFAAYPQGNDFVMNGDQCVFNLNTNIQEKKKEYVKVNNQYTTRVNEMIKTYPNIPDKNVQTSEIYNQLNTKTTEYKQVLNKIDKTKKTNGETYTQQLIDMNILENSNKTNSLLWGISALVIVGMVVTIHNRT
jgi:hypothetical protein